MAGRTVVGGVAVIGLLVACGLGMKACRDHRIEACLDSGGHAVVPPMWSENVTCILGPEDGAR